MALRLGSTLALRSAPGQDKGYPKLHLQVLCVEMMAAAGSQQIPVPKSPNPIQDGETMAVDQVARDKRKAETPVAVNSDDENPKATPVQNPNPVPSMSVEELVRYSIDQNEKHFSKLDKDMAKLQREGSQTRRMAARAVTSAEETKQRVDRLEKRLSQLETQPPKPGLTPKTHHQQPKTLDAQIGRNWVAKRETPSF